jgi:all-trans-retinol dehydrogenase (NAD+)
MSQLLPREGLTLEAAANIGLSILNPIFTGPLLLGLLYYPEQTQSFLPRGAQRYVGSAMVISSLKFLVGWGVLRKINSFLSRIVLNNFTTDAWKYGKEIVVVTGASNGMGAAITREVSMTSASVIALDLYPQEVPFRK